jgi:hypothetical protein
MADIDVKTAVRAALEYVRDAFEEESLSNLGLEEVERRDKTWYVTVGFSRPWDYPKPSPLWDYNPLAQLRQADERPRRDYKVVHVSAESGQVEAVKNRG